jgi:hypothetical protein
VKPSTRRAIVLAGILAALLSGCAKEHHIMAPGIRLPSPYPILTDPYRVMESLRLAYVARDSTEIKKLYDENYVGTSVDQSNPGAPLVLSFSKVDEVRHVAAMARTRTIFNISLQMPPSLTRQSDASDPPGWALIQLPQGTVSLEISDGPTTRAIASNQEQFEFRFIPTTPDPSSPTDTTWKIVRWTEIRF